MYNPQLETFISVAENGSFSKAAEALYITPTAVMKQINALEQRLRVVLFERTNHGLRLTEAGKSLLQDAKYMVDYAKKAVEKAVDIDMREKRKPIRVGVSVMTPAKFLLEVWPEIRAFSPDLKIELIPFDNTPENSREILSNLGQRIDIVAGIYDDWLMNDRGFRVLRLYDKKVLVAVPLKHVLANKTRILPGDLRESGIMLIKEGWNVYVDEIRKDLVSDGVTVSDFDFFSIDVFNRAEKDNIPVMAIDGWENVHPLLKIIPAEWNYKIPFGIMYSRTPSRQVKDFINILEQVVRA